MKTTRLRARLLEVEPSVVRVVDVPAGVLLPELHDLLQAALGWTDSHLHAFEADDTRYGMPGTEATDDELDESGVVLRSLPARFRYLYDFGDGWEHEVQVVGAGGEEPGCLMGTGACPPEDVGGPHGYQQFLEALGDPTHTEHEEMKTWAGSWSPTFDLEAADLLVRQTAGAVPATVRLVLDLAAAGVKLTPGGRMPRAFVREVQGQYPDWHLGEAPAALEEDLPPLAALHDLLRGVGLLRLRDGVLRPTRAARDDTQTIRRLRSWFGPPTGFDDVLVGESLAHLATAGPCRPHELAGRVLPLLGHGWRTGAGEPLGVEHVRRSLYRMASVLVGLGLVETTRGTWSAGPSALWLLPRATALAQLWRAGESEDELPDGG